MGRRTRRATATILLALWATALSGGERRPPVGVDATEAQYDAALSGGNVAFAEPNGVTVGPVAVRILTAAEFDEFLTMAEAIDLELNDRDLRELSVEVKAVSLPNFTFKLSDQLARVRVARVFVAGRPMPVDAETSLRLTEAGPQPHLHGTAKILLPPGTLSQDVTAVEGTVTLRLPLELGSRDFAVERPGRRAGRAGLDLTLLEGSAHSVTFEYQGRIANLLALTGHDAQGEPVARKHHWISGQGAEAIPAEVLAAAPDEQSRKFLEAIRLKRFHYEFVRPIQTVRAWIVGRFAERDYGFRVSR